MKKFLFGTLCFVVCVATASVVNAWGLAHFDNIGKEYTMQGNMTGNFIHKTTLLNVLNLPENKMTITMTSSKPGILGIGWSDIKSTNCNFNRNHVQNGQVSNDAICQDSVNFSGTKKIRTVWKQKNRGYVVAEIDRY